MLEPLSQESWSRENADHLLHRATFGGTPAEREAFYELGRTEGVEAAIDSLLKTTEAWDDHPLPDWMQDPVDRNGDNYASQGVRRRLLAEWYHKQLAEGQGVACKLHKFFQDHFPIDSATSNQYVRYIYLFDYNIMLRRHAAGDVDGDGRYGNFKTLVNDVSWSPAMIRMLDLYESRRGSINENFGRELLELFTLGVDGGYDEEDVGAAAEAFTGRRLYNYQSPHPNAPNRNPPFAPEGELPGGAYQDTNRQDFSQKELLGQTQTPGGDPIVDGDDVLDVVFADIRCARHLCWKLWRYFASPEPDDALLDALAARFRDTHDYEIRPLLKDIFLSQEFYADEVRSIQVKDASDILQILLKQLGLPMIPNYPLEVINDQLGYNIVFPPNIAGWPEPEGEGNAWLSSGSTVFRFNLPSLFTHNNVGIISITRAQRDMAGYPEPDWDDIAPEHLRALERFPQLIEELRNRFLPSTTLRKSQIRVLYDRYRHISEKIDTLEAVKEIIRLLTALPEYQIQ